MTKKKTLSTLGVAALLFTLTACGSGGEADETGSNAGGAVSVDTDANAGGSTEPSSRVGEDIVETYVGFWDAVASRDYAAAAAWGHPDWLADIQVEFSTDDPTVAVEKWVHWTAGVDADDLRQAAAQGWETTHVITSEAYPNGYAPDLSEDELLAYQARGETVGVHPGEVCLTVDEAFPIGSYQRYGDCMVPLDLSEERVGVHSRWVRFANEWDQYLVVEQVDGGWQVYGDED